MSDTKLLPCPFCGKEVTWGYDRDCHKLGCLCPANPTFLAATEEACIAAWNTRALTPEQEAAKDMREALEAALRTLQITRATLLEAGGSEMPTLNGVISHVSTVLAKAGKP